MADRKISELTNITGANLADDDEFALVDTSADETKAITFGEFKTALDTATGFVRITGDTMTGALDVQSTITADGLTVDGGANLNGFVDVLSTTDISGTDVYDEMLRLDNTSGRGAGSGIGISFFQGTNERGRISSEYDDTGQGLHFYSRQDGQGLRERLAITGRGDISFYEDTGTTPKFFWDASAERLGLGTSSPQTSLHIQQTSATAILRLHRTGATNAADAELGQIEFYNADGTSDGPNVTGKIVGSTHTSTGAGGNLRFFTHDGTEGGEGSDPVERVRIDGAGNVGIGTSSPSKSLHILNASSTGSTNPSHLRIEGNSSNYYDIGRDNSSTGYLSFYGSQTSATGYIFGGVDGERMRLDASGNLLVGTTDTNGGISASDTDGSAIALSGSTGQAYFTSAQATANAGSVGYFNRKTSDGEIVQFRKDGVTVGSIGTESNELFIDGDSTATGISFKGVHLRPRLNGADTDNAVDLGAGSFRFKDLYLSGGVYLGGTGSANKLHDYEYGFFEPTYTGGTTNPSGVTYDSVVGNEGWYVKVGRAVFIQINIRTDAISSVGAGDLKISGLPFASASVSGQGGIASFAIGQVVDFAGEAPDSAYVHEGSTDITLFYRSSFNGSSSTSQCSDLGTGTNDNLIRLSGTYYSTE